MADSVLESPPLNDVGVWKDVALLLLGATADHAVHCGDGAIGPFQQLVRESIQTLQGSSSASQVLMSAGGLSQAISHYSSQTQKQVDALLVDATATVQMFLSHLDALQPDLESQTALAALRVTLEAALREGKLGSAKEALAESLAELSKRAEEKHQRTLELTSKLQDRITLLEQSPARLPASSSQPSNGAPAQTAVDSSTGLPKRGEAETAINRALDAGADGPQSYAAVFYLHRMALTNARFGEAIGNQVILFCSQHLATTVARGNDSLYRWSGPAFVAILERSESESAVSTEVQRLISAPFSRFFETSSRSVYLPVKVTADVIPLFNTNFAEVVDRLGNFVLKTSGQTASD